MDWTVDPVHEIGLAGFRHGRPLDAEAIEEVVRRINRISFQDGAAQFMLPETIHAIRPRVAKGQVIVHRTHGVIDGACGYEYLDVSTSRFQSSKRSFYRLVDVRGLMVAAVTRRVGIGWRLVRQVCLEAMAHSPLERGEHGAALRSMCCVAAIDPENVPALELAQSMGAILDSDEGPAIHSNPALVAYALTCREYARRSGKRVPTIAIFRNVDLEEAALFAVTGIQGMATTEFGARVEVTYDQWWSPYSEFASIIQNLALHAVDKPCDSSVLKRLGLDESIHTEGMGNVFWGAITPDMSYSIEED